MNPGMHNKVTAETADDPCAGAGMHINFRGVGLFFWSERERERGGAGLATYAPA